MKLKTLDSNSLRKLLITENKRIIDLWKILPIVGQHLSGQEDENNESGPEHRKGGKRIIKFGEGTARARSLQDLHEKLNNLKGKRLVYKEKLLKKGLKNRLNKKRKKEENSFKKNLSRKILVTSTLEEKYKSVPKPVKQIYNEEGKLVFNKFDFSESGISSVTHAKKDKNEKNPRKILQKLEEQNEKLKNLEFKGEVDKAKLIKEKISWKNALQKAEGLKIKDDPELLKKSLRKETDKKRQSKKKWLNRKEKVKQQQQEKQAKRTENIQARKKQVKLKKLKKAAKKGRIVPGF